MMSRGYGKKLVWNELVNIGQLEWEIGHTKRKTDFHWIFMHSSHTHSFSLFSYHSFASENSVLPIIHSHSRILPSTNTLNSLSSLFLSFFSSNLLHFLLLIALSSLLFLLHLHSFFHSQCWLMQRTKPPGSTSSEIQYFNSLIFCITEQVGTYVTSSRSSPLQINIELTISILTVPFFH